MAILGKKQQQQHYYKPHRELRGKSASGLGCLCMFCLEHNHLKDLQF